MSKTVLPTHNGVNATLLINGTWEESLSGVRGWSLNCNGMFIKNKESFDQLEQAFYNGDSIDVKITDGSREYSGTGLITRFPVSAAYNDAYIYNITILGTGALS